MTTDRRKGEPDAPDSDKRKDRAARLALALRENLLRRKRQKRARKAVPPPPAREDDSGA